MQVTLKGDLRIYEGFNNYKFEVIKVPELFNVTKIEEIDEKLITSIRKTFNNIQMLLQQAYYVVWLRWIQIGELVHFCCEFHNRNKKIFKNKQAAIHFFLTENAGSFSTLKKYHKCFVLTKIFPGIIFFLLGQMYTATQISDAIPILLPWLVEKQDKGNACNWEREEFKHYYKALPEQVQECLSPEIRDVHEDIDDIN